MNFLRSLLKAGAYLLDRSDRVLAVLEDNGSGNSNGLRRASALSQSEIIVSAISFATGIGLGVGVGLLVAPASGKETRGTVVGKVQEFGKKTRDRFSFDTTKTASGTEGH